MAQNTICHVEFDVTDLQRSQAFFGAIFDWTFRSFGEEMVVFGVGEQHLGGLMKVEQVVPGNSPSIWVEVVDIESTLAKAEKAGGKIVKTKSEVPNVGWSGQFSDLDGNSVGIVQFG